MKWQKNKSRKHKNNYKWKGTTNDKQSTNLKKIDTLNESINMIERILIKYPWKKPKAENQEKAQKNGKFAKKSQQRLLKTFCTEINKKPTHT